MGFTDCYLPPEEIAKRRVTALLKKTPCLPPGVFVMGTIPVSARMTEDAILLLNENFTMDEISISKYRKDIKHHTFANEIRNLANQQFDWSVWVY